MALSDCPKCWETPCSCGHENPAVRRVEELERLNAELCEKLEFAVHRLEDILKGDDGQAYDEAEKFVELYHKWRRVKRGLQPHLSNR